ncbi:MAG: hypothetical protein ACRKGH_06205 [Dehalogenimonas sp.]
MNHRLQILKCPRCGGSFANDPVAEFSSCINCGHDIVPGKEGKIIRGKWSEVVYDGRNLGWEAACRKWRLGKSARKRLKRELK